MAAVSSIGGISQDQFLQILLAQLQYQDPTSPADPSTFITQLSSLSSVEGIQTLNANFAQVLQLEQLGQGANLIGKVVDYTPAGGGANATGTVNSVTVQNGQFVLQIGNDNVGLDQIVGVRDK